MNHPLRTLLLALVFLANAVTGCANRGGGAAVPAGFESSVSEIQIVTTKVGTKNVFIPSTIVVTAGKLQTLTLYNTTDTPHGFRIPDLGIETVLYPEKETTVELPALEGGKVHAITCHLHPPHRTATLVVLPGK
jgi:hypothetical protein